MLRQHALARNIEQTGMQIGSTSHIEDHSQRGLRQWPSRFRARHTSHRHTKTPARRQWLHSETTELVRFVNRDVPD